MNADADEFLSDEEREQRRLEIIELEANQKAFESKRFWADVFASQVGRREMFALLGKLGTFDHPFAVGPNGFPQPEATWARYGAAAVGLDLYRDWLLIHPEAAALMIRESGAA